MPKLTFLGPQRFEPNLAPTLRRLGIEGPVATVTAGWQEREREDDELRSHLEGTAVVDLLLYHRADDVLVRDRELAEGMRARQERLHELQRLYRLRLDRELDAARELIALPGTSRILQDQRKAAIRAVRLLDRQHLRRIRALHDEFDRRWRPLERPAIARHRQQLERALAESAVVAIAGGHVAVLVNRIRLFGLDAMLQDRPVVAWSAGAMALTERIVLFHDSPPQGAGNAEVFDAGIGLAPGVVALPHARARLRLSDPVRVGLLARRFSPALCVALEAGDVFDWDGDSWTSPADSRALVRSGRLRAVARA